MKQQPHEKVVPIRTLICQKCGHGGKEDGKLWIPRGDKDPIFCPVCKNPKYWEPLK